MESKFDSNTIDSMDPSDPDLSCNELVNDIRDSMKSLLKDPENSTESGDCIDVECSGLKSQVCAMSCAETSSTDKLELKKKSFCCSK